MNNFKELLGFKKFRKVSFFFLALASYLFILFSFFVVLPDDTSFWTILRFVGYGFFLVIVFVLLRTSKSIKEMSIFKNLKRVLFSFFVFFLFWFFIHVLGFGFPSNFLMNLENIPSWIQFSSSFILIWAETYFHIFFTLKYGLIISSLLMAVLHLFFWTTPLIVTFFVSFGLFYLCGYFWFKFEKRDIYGRISSVAIPFSFHLAYNFVKILFS